MDIADVIDYCCWSIIQCSISNVQNSKLMELNDYRWLKIRYLWGDDGICDGYWDYTNF